MVELARQGLSSRAVARQCHVSLDNVQRWARRAAEDPLDAVDWGDRPRAPHTTQRTSEAMEARVLSVRQWLRDESALGEYGARAIYEALRAQRTTPLLSVRTIGRILDRCGALDGRRRIRRPAPFPGWYLPDVAMRRAELDSVDAIEDLTIVGGVQVDILTCVSLHGGLPGAWPGPTLTTNRLIEGLITHWDAVGLPTYAQFDNAPYFTGAQRYHNVLGRLVRVCLGLNVVPVFVPPHESGFQAAIESFNGRWQAKVWHRFFHTSMQALCRRSDRYIAAYRHRLAPRLETAPHRRRLPTRWRPAQGPVPRGRIVYVRRTDERGSVEVLGRRFNLSTTWPHRLVRCEVALSTGRASFFALRRRQPNDQPLLQNVSCRWDLRAPWK